MPGLLAEQVRRKIDQLGDEAAAQFFDVCLPYIKQWKSGSRAIPAAALERIFQDTFAKPAPVISEPNWTGRKLSWLLPFYDQVDPRTVMCVLGNWERSKMRMQLGHGDAAVWHTRNSLAKAFLAHSECEWCVSTDDDMLFPFGDAEWFNKTTGFTFSAEFAGLHTVTRLLSHRKSLVGGMYFGRSASGKPMFAEGCNDSAIAADVRRGPKDELRPTRWVATGLLLIHRSVFEAISKKFPEFDGNWFSPGQHDLYGAVEQAQAAMAQQDFQKAAALLEEGRQKAAHNSKTGMGEDVQFCIRAAQSGHQPYVDLGLVCGHIGSCVYGPHNTRAETL